MMFAFVIAFLSLGDCVQAGEIITGRGYCVNLR